MKNSVTTLTPAIGVLLAGTCCAIAAEKKGAPLYTFETQTLTLANHEVQATVLSVRNGENNDPVRKPLINIPNAAGSFTAAQRAEIIRGRAEAATSENPNWYDHLTCKMDRTTGDWVVTSPVFAAKSEPLVTLDKQFLNHLKRINNQRRNSDVAEAVREGIMLALNPRFANQLGEGRDLLDSHFVNAVTHTTNGAYFFHEYGTLHLRNRLAIAISEYKTAINENPHHVSAMEQLVELYKLDGKTTEAADLKSRMAAIELALPELTAGNEALPEKVDGVSTNSKDLADIPKLNTAIGHYKKAIAKFDGCISFHVILSDCYQTLADIHRNNGNLEAARQDSAQEAQSLKDIPANVLRTASTPFKVYVTNRLKKLQP